MFEASRERRALSRTTAAGLMSLAVAFTAACTSDPGADPVGAESGSSASPGTPVSVRVSPDEPFRLEVPGVATITGDVGSVRSEGAVTALAATGDAAESAGVAIAGPGVDVAVLGTSLAAPLTVTFHQFTGGAGPGVLPAVLHRGEDGSVDVRFATADADGNLVVTTSEFSVNLPALVDVRKWLTDRIDSIVDGVTGRTDPPPCKDDGPEWASLDSTSDLVHACLITNTSQEGVARAEAQFASNRRTYLFVDIPEGASYAWVEDMPEALRNALARFWGYDSDRGAVIRGGKRITAGYVRPSAVADKTFHFSINRATATMSTVAPLLDVLNLKPEQSIAVALLLVAKCGDKIPGSLQSAADTWEVVRCVVGDGLSALSDPGKAFATAMDLFGDAAYAKKTEDALSGVSGALEFFGKAIRTGSLAFSVRDTWVQVFDSATQAFAPDSQQATLRLMPPATTQSAEPQAPQEPTPPQAQAATAAAVPPPPPPPSNADAQPEDTGVVVPAPGSGGIDTDQQATGEPPFAGDPAPPVTWTEQSGRHGSPTFQVVTNASGPGPVIAAMSYVEVSCKVKPATTIDSAMPGGYWYRIASAPWSDAYYAVANTFWNGDIPGQEPYTHDFDPAVPDC